MRRKPYKLLKILLISSLLFSVAGTIISRTNFLKNPVSAAEVYISSPQYIAIRSADYNRVRTDPESIFKEVLDTLGTRGTPHRRLALEFIFDPLRDSNETLLNTVTNVLNLSKKYDIPVIIKFDLVNWWDSRPDLWNWFEPGTTGFNVENKKNVEWYGWDESTAIKIMWRNWGKQLRVRPGPNLASPAFRNAHKEVLDQVLPKIKAHYDSLPLNVKYQFGGIVWGMEISVPSGLYPNPNYYYDKCPQPYGWDEGPCGIDPNKPDLYSNGGHPKLGYNAAKTMGIKTSGTLTAADRDIIVKDFTNYINQIGLSYGLPPSKFYSHGGGDFGDKLPWAGTYGNSKVANLNPGWSFYGEDAANPALQLSEFMQDSNNAIYPWAAPEWHPDATGKMQWVNRIETTANYKNNKLVAMANWESIYPNNTNAIEGFKYVLNSPASNFCNVTPTMISRISSSGTDVTIEFTENQPNTASYLNVSTLPNSNGFSHLASANVHNSAITGLKSIVIKNVTSKIYTQVITDGCVTASGSKRVVSDISAFTPTTQPQCKKSSGDADCNGKINMSDFNIYLDEFVKFNKSQAVQLKADFNNDKKISIADYNIWFSNYRKALGL